MEKCDGLKVVDSYEKDSRFGWVIVALCFICHTIVWGILWTVGLWNTVFYEAFGQSLAYTAVVGSAINAINYIAGLIGSVFVRQYGHRRVIVFGALVASIGFGLSSVSTSVDQLLLSFSLFVGFGLGLTYIPAIVIIEEYFDRRSSLAFGFSLAGVGFGMLVYPPLNQYFIDVFGWRGALRANVGLTMILVTCGLFMQAPRANKAAEVTGSSPWSDLINAVGMFKNLPYSAFCLANLLFFFSLTITWVHVNGHIVSVGLAGQSVAGLAFGVIGVSNIFGRLLLGALISSAGLRAAAIFAAGNFGLALIQIYMSVADTFSSIMIACAMFGLLSSIVGPLLPAILIDLLGKELLGLGYGFLLIFEGIGALMGPPVAGHLYEWAKTYDSSFYLAAMSYALCGTTMAITVLTRNGHKANESLVIGDKKPKCSHV